MSSGSRTSRCADRTQVLTRWQKYFDAPQPPFSWSPETVEVQDGGKLALSHRAGGERRRQTCRHLHVHLAPRAQRRVAHHLRPRLPGLRLRRAEAADTSQRIR